jgi:hypothetical protein
MEGPGRFRQWRCDSNTTKIVIPAWVTKLTYDSFEPAAIVDEITFEAGSQLRELDFRLLSTCKSLKSICIPASIEVIHFSSPEDGIRYSRISSLERVTFEAGSRLQEIQGGSFCRCRSLQSICLPASVRSMDGSCFVHSSLKEIVVESGNRFFRVNGPFLLDFAGVRIVRYFGDEIEVTIPNKTETLGYCSFASTLISTIRFESMSNFP